VNQIARQRLGDLIVVSIQFEYDPGELAAKILCVVIFVCQIVFNLNTTPDEIQEKGIGTTSRCGMILETPLSSEYGTYTTFKARF